MNNICQVCKNSATREAKVSVVESPKDSPHTEIWNLCEQHYEDHEEQEGMFDSYKYRD